MSQPCAYARSVAGIIIKPPYTYGIACCHGVPYYFTDDIDKALDQPPLQKAWKDCQPFVAIERVGDGFVILPPPDPDLGF